LDAKRPYRAVRVRSMHRLLQNPKWKLLLLNEMVDQAIEKKQFAKQRTQANRDGKILSRFGTNCFASYRKKRQRRLVRNGSDYNKKTGCPSPYCCTWLFSSAPSFAADAPIDGANTALDFDSHRIGSVYDGAGLSLTFMAVWFVAKNVLFYFGWQCYSIAALVSVIWLVVGYSIFIGPAQSWFFWGGLDKDS